MPSLPPAMRRLLDALSRHRVLLLYGLIIIGCGFRIYEVIDHNPMEHIWSDPQRHWEQGTQVLRTDPMTMTDPPLYQVYVGIIGKLTLGSKPLVAFYTILLSLITPWIWYRFCRELLPRKSLALVAWAIFTWLPSWLSIFSYFMQETLMLPMLGAALWSSWRAKRRGDIKSFCVMVVLWALAGLTRGICIPFAAITVTWLWWAYPQKWQKAALGSAILVLILGPLTYRSYEQMRVFSPHGIGMMNALYAKSGNKVVEISYNRFGAVWTFGFQSPSLGSYPLRPLSNWRTEREDTARIFVDVSKGYEDWDRAAEQYSPSFRKYLWIASENLIYLFFGHSWPDSNLAYDWGKLNYWMRWLWAPLGIVVLGATALHLWRRRHGLKRASALTLSESLLIPVFIVVWFLIQGLLPLAVNEGRYRKPVEGLLIVQALYLLSQRKPKPNANLTHSP